MLENIKEFWFLYVAAFVLLVITLFVLKKAIAAAGRHSKEVNEALKRAQQNKELCEKYKELTPDLIANAPADELFKGIALNLEANCQSCADLESFYSALNSSQKAVYSLYYLLSDALKDSLSSFFKGSTRPLTSDAVNASQKTFEENIYCVIKKMFDCYDDENETESVIPEKIEELNSKFADLTADINLYAIAGEQIKKNVHDFIK